MNINHVRIICTVLIISGALFIVLLERKYPYTKGQKLFREGFLNDFVLYTFVQSFVMGIIISYIIVFIDSHTRLSAFQLLTKWPASIQLIFFFLLHDLYIYWFHRWQHNNKYLWRIHEAHHTNKDIDWIAGSRSHPLEILIDQTIEFAPMILLGADPSIPIVKGMIDALWGMYIHSNIDVHSGKLQFFINGPEMHRWHHADKDEKAYNKNFATKLAVWDWIFKTAYLPTQEKPQYYGLSYLNFPKRYIKQIFFAFRKFEQ